MVFSSEEKIDIFVPGGTFTSSGNARLLLSSSSTNGLITGKGVATQPTGFEETFFRFSLYTSVVVEDNIAYVTDLYKGIIIFNVSRLHDPEIIKKMPLEGEMWHLEKHGQYLYIACGSAGIKIVDITFPPTPQLVTTFVDGDWQSVQGITVRNGYSYLVEQNKGLIIVNTTRVTQPVLLGWAGNTGNALEMNVKVNDDGDTAFVAGLTGYGGDLTAFNITDKASPVQQGKLSGLDFKIAVDSNGLVYATKWFSPEGLHIVDFSDRENPLELATDGSTISCGGNRRNTALALDRSKELVYIGMDSMILAAINATNKTHPVCMDFFSDSSVTGFVEEIFLYGESAFVVGSLGLFIIDISNPYSLSLISSYLEEASGHSKYTAVSENYLYVVVYEGIIIADVTNPYNVSALAKVNVDDPIEVFVEKNLMFVSHSNKVSVFSVLNVNSPDFITQVDASATVLSIFAEDERVLYVGTASSFQIFNISDLANVYELSITPTDDVNSFKIRGDVAYLCNWAQGLLVVNISDLSDPFVTYRGISDEPPGSIEYIGIDVMGSFVYVVSTGYYPDCYLIVYNITDNATTPTFISYVTIGYNCEEVVISGNFAYIAIQGGGIQIFDIWEKTDIKLNTTLGDEIESDKGLLETHFSIVTHDGFKIYRTISYYGIAVYNGGDFHLVDESNRFKCGSVSVTLRANDDEGTAEFTFQITRTYDSSKPSNLCRGNGECYDFDKCQCISTYNGTTCEFPRCYGHPSYEEFDVCYGRGQCVSPDSCVCHDPNSYIGERCHLIHCFGHWSNSTNVCGSHGSCLEKDTCLCLSGYESSVPFHECDDWKCLQYYHTDSRACSGRGECVSPDLCRCEDDDWEGDDCESWSCGSIPKDDVGVCSGHGVCSSPGNCDCNSNYIGSSCGTNSLYFSVMSPLLVLLGVSILTIFSCLICLICLLLCCGTGILFLFLLLGLLALGGVVVKQFAGLKKYGQLDNFDILLQEQKVEKDSSIAHLRLKKELFQVEYSDIQILSILGEGGSSAVVFRCKYGGNECAFKCFKTRMLMNTQDKFEEFEREVELLSSLTHPNIIRFYGACLNPPRVGILMELCTRGEILDFVKEFRKENMGIRYPLNELFSLICEISSALEFLHSKKIIHRDLKSENVLISEDRHARVMDFGLSKLVDRLSARKMTTRVGTTLYMAPEIILTENYDEMCDVFSLSILIYILLTENEHPYGHENENQIELKVANNPACRPDTGVIENSLDTQYHFIIGVLQKSWDADPLKRYTCKEIRETIEERILQNICDDHAVSVVVEKKGEESGIFSAGLPKNRTTKSSDEENSVIDRGECGNDTLVRLDEAVINNLPISIGCRAISIEVKSKEDWEEFKRSMFSSSNGGGEF